jgi:hypothetical protein
VVPAGSSKGWLAKGKPWPTKVAFQSGPAAAVCQKGRPVSFTTYESESL